MYATGYVRPKNIKQAVAAFNKADDAKYLGGGMTLIPTMKQRLAAPDCLVDLAGCKLDTITPHPKSRGVMIGAMATHAHVAAHAGVNRIIPALAALAGGIGDRQVRNSGTIGGSMANNDPAACYPAAALALGASIITDRRLIEADDFFTGLFETALEDDEIITAVAFPKAAKAGYAKFRNPASRYAVVGVFVAKMADGVRVAVTGAGDDGVFRASGIENALAKKFSGDALDGVKIKPDGLMSDIHAAADYRAHLIMEMAKRAVATAK